MVTIRASDPAVTSCTTQDNATDETGFLGMNIRHTLNQSLLDALGPNAWIIVDGSHGQIVVSEPLVFHKGQRLIGKDITVNFAYDHDAESIESPLSFPETTSFSCVMPPASLSAQFFGSHADQSFMTLASHQYIAGISMIGGHHVFDIPDNVFDIYIQDCDLGGASGDMVAIKDAHHVQFDRISLRHGAGNGIVIQKGRDIAFHQIDMMNIGKDAVQVTQIDPDYTKNISFDTVHLHNIGGAAFYYMPVALSSSITFDYRSLIPIVNMSASNIFADDTAEIRRHYREQDDAALSQENQAAIHRFDWRGDKDHHDTSNNGHDGDDWRRDF